MHSCPCCGQIIYDGPIPKLCGECADEGCEMTEDSTGELGYWECQLPLYEYEEYFYDDVDPYDDEYDRY